MDEKLIGTAVLGNAIVEWLADEVLQNSDPVLYGERYRLLRGVGMPILRGQVSFSNTPSTLRRQRIELECAESRRCGEFSGSVRP
jgi:hypothetical protein